jgi:predicted transposase YdaD
MMPKAIRNSLQLLPIPKSKLMPEQQNLLLISAMPHTSIETANGLHQIIKLLLAADILIFYRMP